jgi:Arc/MetJ-type ribon-helix-helix transcriptional regulator
MATELPADAESFLQREVTLGAFPSREDALLAGVDLLRRRRELIDRLAESRRQLDEGEYIELDDLGLNRYFDELKERARRQAEQQ